MANRDLTINGESEEHKKGNEVSANFSDEEKVVIKLYKDKLNLSSTADVIQYGVGSQTKVSNFSNEILKQVRTRDMGGAEDILLNLRADIKSFDENLNKKPLIPFFDNLKKKVKRMRTEYQSVEKNIHQ